MWILMLKKINELYNELHFFFMKYYEVYGSQYVTNS
jgi:hypothetical protein